MFISPIISWYIFQHSFSIWKSPLDWSQCITSVASKLKHLPLSYHYVPSQLIKIYRMMMPSPEGVPSQAIAGLYGACCSVQCLEQFPLCFRKGRVLSQCTVTAHQVPSAGASRSSGSWACQGPCSALPVKTTWKARCSFLKNIVCVCVCVCVFTSSWVRMRRCQHLNENRNPEVWAECWRQLSPLRTFSKTK